jgi:hypothetical protein
VCGLPFSCPHLNGAVSLYQNLPVARELAMMCASTIRPHRITTTTSHLERFPAYAPELNPDEGVWQHLKHLELRNVCCINFAHLRIELDLAIRRLRRRSDLIRSFFAGAELNL